MDIATGEIAFAGGMTVLRQAKDGEFRFHAVVRITFFVVHNIALLIGSASIYQKLKSSSGWSWYDWKALPGR